MTPERRSNKKTANMKINQMNIVQEKTRSLVVVFVVVSVCSVFYSCTQKSHHFV